MSSLDNDDDDAFIRQIAEWISTPGAQYHIVPMRRRWRHRLRDAFDDMGPWVVLLLVTTVCALAVIGLLPIWTALLIAALVGLVRAITIRRRQ